MATGVTRNITASLPIPLYPKDWDMRKTLHFRGLLVGTWLADDAAVLIYDNYDIWRIDPAGKKSPLNLTNGRNRNLTFKLTSECLKRVIQPHDVLLLQVFNNVSKQSGF